MFTPRIRRMLLTFEPIIFPIPKLEAPWAIEETVTESSGREVPIATPVAPTTRGEIFSDEESFSVERTK